MQLHAGATASRVRIDQPFCQDTVNEHPTWSAGTADRRMQRWMLTDEYYSQHGGPNYANIVPVTEPTSFADVRLIPWYQNHKKKHASEKVIPFTMPLKRTWTDMSGESSGTSTLASSIPGLESDECGGSRSRSASRGRSRSPSKAGAVGSRGAGPEGLDDAEVGDEFDLYH